MEAVASTNKRSLIAGYCMQFLKVSYGYALASDINDTWDRFCGRFGREQVKNTWSQQITCY